MSLIIFHAVISVTVFAAVFLLIWTLFRFPVSAESPVHRRIAESMGAQRRATLFENPVTAPLLSLSLALAGRFDFPGVRARVRQELDSCGNPQGYDVDEHLALGLISGVGTGAVALVVALALTGSPLIPLVVVMAVAGLVAPFRFLRSAARARLKRISKKLPYTLDLVSLMMGAGSTFTEAIDAIIRDEPDDDFNQELRIVQAEIEFGTKRGTALQNLSDRIPIETLRSIVGAIEQAERLGTPLATILSAQAGMLRLHRSIRAEKLAASASLHILVPTMLVLAAAILTLFGPIIIRWRSGDWSM